MGADADRRLVAGRYVLGGPLGRGGMGTVWRADDVLLGRPVAVKEVELPAGPPGAEREALRERALREARAAARLNHPGVVTLHDAVEADDRLFLVMELVDAPTLRDLVDRSGPVGHWAAARVGLELLDALDAAHRAGIVHHDVKPANVMVAASGRVKLADFGIASLQEDTQRTLTGAMSGRGDGRAVTAVFGSLPYVAPEQASGGHAGPAADLWALGATLWFAVEGVAPFERPGPAATLAAILNDPPGRPSRAGPLEPVLLALLAKDPAHRPPATLLRRMLEPLAGGTTPLWTSQPGQPTVPLRSPTGGPAPGAGQAATGGPGRSRVGAPTGAGHRGRPPAAAGREPLPGWTAPPRRRGRRWGRGLVVVGVLAAAGGGRPSRGRPAWRPGAGWAGGPGSGWAVRVRGSLGGLRDPVGG